MLFRIYEQHSASPSVTTTGKLGLMKRDAAGVYDVPLERVP